MTTDAQYAATSVDVGTTDWHITTLLNTGYVIIIIISFRLIVFISVYAYGQKTSLNFTQTVPVKGTYSFSFWLMENSRGYSRTLNLALERQVLLY